MSWHPWPDGCLSLEGPILHTWHRTCYQVAGNPRETPNQGTFPTQRGSETTPGLRIEGRGD